MLRMQEMAFPCYKFQKISGEYAPDPPIHGWYVGHTRGLQPFLTSYPQPLIYYLTERSLFKKCSPLHGKTLIHVVLKSANVSRCIEMRNIYYCFTLEFSIGGRKFGCLQLS
jgi:hypothetical protein